MAARRPTLVACAAFALFGGACAEDMTIDLLAGNDAGTMAGGGASSSSQSGSGGADAGDAGCIEQGCACGLASCPAACVDLANDPMNCGECDHGCLHYGFCQAEACTCLPGFTLCNGACRHFDSDPANCGGCDHPCASGEKCEGGHCSTGACTAPLASCPEPNGTIACVDLSGDDLYCGHCSTVCGPDQVCAGSTCQTYAPATPCTGCPCDDVCAAAVGTPASCCPGIAGGVPICVHGASCP